MGCETMKGLKRGKIFRLAESILKIVYCFKKLSVIKKVYQYQDFETVIKV